LRQKGARDSISPSKKLRVDVCACHPTYGGSTNWRIMVQAGLTINMRHYLKKKKKKKQAKTKKVKGVTQVVEYLPTKVKSFELKCQLLQKKKKERKRKY
jgi:hypothetical protein